MKKHPILFMAGFASGYLPALMLLVRLNDPKVAVVAQTPPEAITIVLQTTGPVITPGNVVLAATEEENVGTVSTPEPTETPTPLPTPTPDVWPPAEFAGWFSQYAGQYGVDINALERIANCESHFNPTAESGEYLGMFQFSPSTWQTYRSQMGLDINPALRVSPQESIKTAAYAIKQEGTILWPSCLR